MKDNSIHDKALLKLHAEIDQTKRICSIMTLRDLKTFPRRDTYRLTGCPLEDYDVFEFFEAETYLNNISVHFVCTLDREPTIDSFESRSFSHDFYVRCYKYRFIVEDERSYYTKKEEAFVNIDYFLLFHLEERWCANKSEFILFPDSATDSTYFIDYEDDLWLSTPFDIFMKYMAGKRLLCLSAYKHYYPKPGVQYKGGYSPDEVVLMRNKSFRYW